MRVLLSTIGSRGDVQPLVALGLQLDSLGAQVRLCVPPDFRDWIVGLGLDVAPIGPDVRQAGRRPADQAPPSPEQQRQMMAAFVDNQFETIAAAAEGCDAIVAATALQVATASVADRASIPYIFAAYAPIVLPSRHHAPPRLPPVPGEPPSATTTDNGTLWARDAERFNATFAAALNACHASRGLAPVEDVRSHMFTDHPWLAADPTLAPWPDPADGAVLQTGAWVLPDDRPLSAEMETFLRAGGAPVYFGFGSTHVAQNVGRIIAQVARRLGSRAIVSRGWADLSLVDNEPDCFVVGEVNLQALFPRMAAIVHHGGAGTTTLAALAGVPQVIIPHVYDQHYFAQRVEELGIGMAHGPETPTTESLARALERVLETEAGERARSVAAAMRRDGARVAAETLMRAV